MNAIIALGKALKSLEDQKITFSLAGFKGGIADNVIPYSSQAIVCTTQSNLDTVKEILSHEFDALLNKHKESDPNGVYKLEMIDIPEYVMSDEMKRSTIDLLCTIPDGVRTHSSELEHFPQVSSNLDVFETDSEHMYALIFVRSSDVAGMEKISNDFEKI